MRFIFKTVVIILGLLVAAFIAFVSFAPAYVEKGRNAVVEHAPYPVSAKAQALHDSLMIGDWHADSLLWKRDMLQRGDRGQVDLPRLIEGNVSLQVFTAVTKSPAGLNYDENSADARDNITLLAVGQMWPMRTWQSLIERALYQAERLHGFAAKSDGALQIIRTRSDLETVITAHSNGEVIVGGLLGIEGAHPLEGDFANFERLFEAGYRLIALQHFFDNELGGSLHGAADHGLTEFGRQVVEEVAARGMVLDIAHSSQQVVRDVLAMTDIPLVLSHTGIRSHCDVKRNIPDALMRDIAASGGVIGIGYWADVTCDDSPKGVARTIVAAIEVVGEDHVSSGSDFDGSVTTAFDTSELAALTQALIDQGLSDSVIAKVMGQNMLRVLRDRLKD